jgi:hypothetical protein
MLRLKRINWLIMSWRATLDEKKVKSKKSVWSLFMLIVFSVILAVSLCLAFNPIGDIQNSNALSAGLLSASDGRSLVEVKITADEAVKIAIPFAEQFAQENNLTITNTAEPSLINDDRPEWYIEVEFEAVTGRGHLDYINAYQIAVWADTGEIWYHGRLSTVNLSVAEVKITADEAVKIAMPLVEQHAKETNRTITTVVEAWVSDRFNWKNPDSRPIWTIIVRFEGTMFDREGYSVQIWADTGEICSHEPWGVY